jgi:predicted nucleic acid-binding protein
MVVYADTSVLIAWFHPADLFAQKVTEWHRRQSVEFCWNPILRAELRHNLRRLTGRYARIAWHAYSMAEASRRFSASRHRLSDLLALGDELSARYAGQTTCGTWDCIHVAAAQRASCEAFATCDPPQAELARLAGLQHVQLFAR